MQHMGAKGMKALFFNGFHIYIYMWQKGGKRGQKPLILLEAVFCFNFASLLFTLPITKKPLLCKEGRISVRICTRFGCIGLCVFLPISQGMHSNAPTLDFCVHLRAVCVMRLTRPNAHFSSVSCPFRVFALTRFLR